MRSRRPTFPDVLEPQLASSAKQAPAGDAWIHEIKHDGYRILCRKRSGDVRLFTRNGHDWTVRLPAVAAAVANVPLDDCWLDGELLVFAADGRSDFLALQRALGRKGAQGLVYHAWDVMYARGTSLLREPLVERKAILREALANAPAAVLFTDHVVGKGPAVFNRADALDLEGIVSKRARSPYRPGQRSPDWVKVKVWRVYDVELVGVELDASGDRVSSLLLGERSESGALVYAGRVELGVPSMSDLTDQLRDLRAAPPWPEMAKPGRCWLPDPIPMAVRAIPRRAGEPLRHATLVR